MVYVVGFFGFSGGFSLGLLILYYLLKGRSNKELLSSTALKWTYGLFVWLMAGAGTYSAVYLYKIYFG